jgi:hypothetical protein
MAKLVDLVGGDARLDEGLDVVQHFRGQSAGQPHAFNVFGCFQGNGHSARLSQRLLAAAEIRVSPAKIAPLSVSPSQRLRRYAFSVP